ncbi:neocarzinostatin apoprotein domain-containing protein [Nocardia sp. NBC_01327]|uniref:neocarzinostatin apoprotein domain-containing protein n=1 Tax=Nocardia sp. NBC_01327 TaxID=2903593 RepID=UPI002E0F0A45|nr:neocarzinostatin apoprotein domain-containing protein [Nocardia sp. NBC_01327]
MRSNIFRGVAGAAVTAAALLATSAPAGAAPVLHPTPTGDVTVGQSITVALDGLPPNLPTVAIGQCKPQITSPADCNLGGSLLGGADAQGIWKPGARGAVVTLVASVGGIDCTSAPGACTLAVTSLTNPADILASVPLTFTKPGASHENAGATADSSSSDSTVVGVIIAIVVVVVLSVILAAVVLRRRRRPR